MYLIYRRHILSFSKLVLLFFSASASLANDAENTNKSLTPRQELNAEKPPSDTSLNSLKEKTPTTSTHNVVIIRTDHIANEIGYAKRVGDMLRPERSRLEIKLAQTKKLLEGDIAVKRKDYEAKPTAEKENNVRTMQQQMQALISQINKSNEETLQRFRSKLKQDFYKQIRPAILQLAAEKNFDVVLDASRLQEGIVYVGPTTDVTDLLIQKLSVGRKLGPSVPQP